MSPCRRISVGNPGAAHARMLLAGLHDNVGFCVIQSKASWASIAASVNQALLADGDHLIVGIHHLQHADSRLSGQDAVFQQSLAQGGGVFGAELQSGVAPLETAGGLVRRGFEELQGLVIDRDLQGVAIDDREFPGIEQAGVEALRQFEITDFNTNNTLVVGHGVPRS